MHADASDIDARSQAYAEGQGALCARVRWTPLQVALIAGLILACASWLVVDPPRAWIGVSVAIAVISAITLSLRLVAMVCAVLRDPSLVVSEAALASLDRASLPSYCILVPLYREPEVVPGLVAAIQALDYPVDRLEVRFLLEPDDAVTAAAIAAQQVPLHMQIMVAPVGQPRTKPRACNVGLAATTAEFLVIYDAEDRPEPDQLLKAVAAYRDLDASVVCLQCRLDHYNSQQSLPARWTSIEYLMWFRLVLPGLQRIGAPIPLGGTSNHFRVQALRAIGGWDPFNVTEDCDLGMRIARQGWQTRMLASTTWEEAVTTVPAWIRQRSRWIKGYVQTWMVHMRAQALSAFGLRGLVLMSVNTIGLFAALVVNPIAWVTVAMWLVVGWSVVDTRSPLSIATLVLSAGLLGTNLLMVAIAVFACVQAGRRDLIAAAMATPLAWMLQSLAAWQAAWEYLVRPFHWQKTMHGRAILDGSRGRFRGVAFVVLALLCAGTVVGTAAWRIGDDIRIQAEARRPVPPPTQLPLVFAGGDEQATALVSAQRPRGKSPWQFAPEAVPPAAGIDPVCLRAAAQFPQQRLDLTSTVRRDLAGVAAIAVDVLVAAEAPPDLRVSAHWCDEDEHWFESWSPQRLIPGQWTRLEFPVRAAEQWQPGQHRRAWHADLLHGVRELGISFVSALDFQGSITIANLRTIPARGGAAESPPLCTVQAMPEYVAVMALWEMAFSPGRSWPNPYDPAIVAMDVAITTPSGQTHRIPAFYFQDYERRMDAGNEVVEAVGAPGWRLRYRPREPGQHAWQLLLSEAEGPAATIASGTFIATPASHAGYIRRSERKPELLQRDDGSFFYPIGQNICHAVDLIPPVAYSFTVAPDQRSYTFDRFFTKMADVGMNAARVWMTPWSYGLEGNPRWQNFHGQGRYNLANAWRLDHLFNEGERLGIAILLTVNHMSEFNSAWTSRAWRDSALNSANGGCLRNPEDFFTHPEVMRLYRQRLRYMVARWGDRPELLAWEFFGEANLMPGFNPSECARWHAELAAYVRSLDLARHLIFTHTHNWQHGNELWRLADIDCIQGNGYIRPPNHSTNHVVNFDRYLAEVSHYRKPVLVAEYGGRSELGAPSEDYLLGQMHSGLWASLMRPFAGVALHWWWNFIDGANLYPHFRGLSRFAAGIDRLERDYRVARAAMDPASRLLVAGMQDAESGFYWIHHPAIFESWADIPAISGGRLSLNDLRPGRYRIEFWDTLSGEIIATRNEMLDAAPTLIVPAVQRDLAVKVMRVADTE